MLTCPLFVCDAMQASVAVWQDVTGKAKEKAVALSMAVGCGYAYETTFEKEVYSDLYGERGCLMGGIRKCSLSTANRFMWGPCHEIGTDSFAQSCLTIS